MGKLKFITAGLRKVIYSLDTVTKYLIRFVDNIMKHHLVNMGLTVLLVYIGLEQVWITERQEKIISRQETLAEKQLLLSEKLAYLHIDPEVDCDLNFSDEGDPFLIIINKSLIKAKSVFVDGYLFGVTDKGEVLPPMVRRGYPGHLFFEEDLKSFEHKRCLLMNLPSRSHRPREIIKFVYAFELNYRRETDMKEYRKNVFYEIDDFNGFSMGRIEKLESYKFFKQIREQMDLVQKMFKRDKPEDFLKY